MGIYLSERQGNVSRDQLRQTKYHFAYIDCIGLMSVTVLDLDIV